MKISQRGIDLIKQFEGYSSKAYPDPATGGAPWMELCSSATRPRKLFPWKCRGARAGPPGRGIRPRVPWGHKFV